MPNRHKSILLHCVHRSGSTAATEWLSKKHNLQDLREPYDFDDGPYLYSDQTQTIEKVKLQGSVSTKLKWDIYSFLKTTHVPFVAKIIPTQFPDLYENYNIFNDAFEHLFLFRNDIVDQILSLCLAKETNIYNSPKSVNLKPFYISEEAVEFVLNENIFLLKLIHKNPTIKTLKYEALKDEWTSSLKKIAYKDEKLLFCCNFESYYPIIMKKFLLAGFKSLNFEESI